jgi:hypothetical protein
MRQSPLLGFESTAFPAEAGEDLRTNPGILGKALAHWLSEQLRGRGVPAGEPIAEDFGWCVPVESTPHTLYVACANEEGSSTRWKVFAFAEGGLVARLLGRDRSAESVAALFASLEEILRDASVVHDLRREAP